MRYNDSPSFGLKFRLDLEKSPIKFVPNFQISTNLDLTKWDTCDTNFNKIGSLLRRILMFKTVFERMVLVLNIHKSTTI